MRAEDLLQAHSVWCEGTVLLHLAGELDLATAPLVENAVAACLAGRPRHILLDLADLTFCDGTGLRALRRVTDRVHAAGVALCLTGVHPHLERSLDHHLGSPSPSPRL
ncbi:STAS domain-containing protein [Streptomyces sp900105245]|uniref:Anti-sigma factor antagonist n=1 Tax=Streptomyces sp. 900105245 TaxID=3154379 RepID=A0ABV1ULT3_9ACTN